jgi:uncharacterized protein
MADEAETLYRQALREATTASPNFARAAQLLEEAARLGHAKATYALATWHLFGKEPFVRRDYDEAVRLLRLAAAAGVPDAMYDLAVCYEKGKGVAKDEREAFENYLRAAIRDDAKAIFAVGRCLFWGIGVAQDQHIARLWLDRADELGTYEPESSVE